MMSRLTEVARFAEQHDLDVQMNPADATAIQALYDAAESAMKCDSDTACDRVVAALKALKPLCGED
jgi:hypothetical protein